MSEDLFSLVILSNGQLDAQQNAAIDRAFSNRMKYVEYTPAEAVERAAWIKVPVVLAADVEPAQAVKAALLAKRRGVRLMALALVVSPDIPGEWIVESINLKAGK